MGSKIFVGGLPFAATEQQLSDLFAQHGSVTSAQVVTDRFTGQSRGFGFVEMSTPAEAQSAIGALNGSQFGGRTLTVNEARPREARSDSGGRNGGFGGRPRFFEDYGLNGIVMTIAPITSWSLKSFLGLRGCALWQEMQA